MATRPELPLLRSIMKTTGRTFKASWSITLGVLLFTSSGAAAAELTRKALLGLRMTPNQAASAGAVVIDAVVPGHTADRLGVRAGDVILAAGGKPVSSSADVVAYAATLRDGNDVRLRIRRGAREMNIRGKALGRPRETYPQATASYGECHSRAVGCATSS